MKVVHFLEIKYSLHFIQFLELKDITSQQKTKRLKALEFRKKSLSKWKKFGELKE